MIFYNICMSNDKIFKMCLTYPVVFVGATGSQGSSGNKGLDGLDGINGSYGPQGVQGSPGMMGVRGPVGHGIVGLQGPPGPIGRYGAPGLMGVDGIDGEDGVNGILGPQGPPGSMGVVGKPGRMGPQGYAGSTGTFEITVEASTSACGTAESSAILYANDTLRLWSAGGIDIFAESGSVIVSLNMANIQSTLGPPVGNPSDPSRVAVLFDSVTSKLFAWDPLAGTAGEWLARNLQGMVSRSSYSYCSTGGGSLQALYSNAWVSVGVQAHGIGFICSNQPDGSFASGECRGNNAIEWQYKRKRAYQIASGNYSSILGGNQNIASGTYSVIMGGHNNKSTAIFTSCAGLLNNVVSNYATIMSGKSNYVKNNYSIIVGGINQTVNNTHSLIIGGHTNYINSIYSVICSGYNNAINTGSYNFIGCGHNNTITKLTSTASFGSNFSCILNGVCNIIGNKNFNSSHNSILNGSKHTIYNKYNVICNGKSNYINTEYAIIFNGYNNKVSNNYVTILNQYNMIGTNKFTTVMSNSNLMGNPIIGKYTTVISSSYITTIDGNFVTMICADKYNQIRGNYSTILNSTFTDIYGDNNTILSGIYNVITGNNNVIINGNTQITGANNFIINAHIYGNNNFGTHGTIMANNSLILNTFYNYIGSTITGSVICVGVYNDIINSESVIIDGYKCTITNSQGLICNGNDNNIVNTNGIIINGKSNKIVNNMKYNFVGGINNYSKEGTIIGGSGNYINSNSFIGNGKNNIIGATTEYSCILNATNSYIYSNNSSIISGNRCLINDNNNVIILGYDNNASLTSHNIISHTSVFLPLSYKYISNTRYINKGPIGCLNTHPPPIYRTHCTVYSIDLPTENNCIILGTYVKIQSSYNSCIANSSYQNYILQSNNAFIASGRCNKITNSNGSCIINGTKNYLHFTNYASNENMLIAGYNIRLEQAILKEHYTLPYTNYYISQNNYNSAIIASSNVRADTILKNAIICGASKSNISSSIKLYNCAFIGSNTLSINSINTATIMGGSNTGVYNSSSGLVGDKFCSVNTFKNNYNYGPVTKSQAHVIMASSNIYVYGLQRSYYTTVHMSAGDGNRLSPKVLRNYDTVVAGSKLNRIPVLTGEKTANFLNTGGNVTFVFNTISMMSSYNVISGQNNTIISNPGSNVDTYNSFNYKNFNIILGGYGTTIEDSAPYNAPLKYRSRYATMGISDRNSIVCGPYVTILSGRYNEVHYYGTYHVPRFETNQSIVIFGGKSNKNYVTYYYGGGRGYSNNDYTIVLSGSGNLFNSVKSVMMNGQSNLIVESTGTVLTISTRSETRLSSFFVNNSVSYMNNKNSPYSTILLNNKNKATNYHTCLNCIGISVMSQYNYNRYSNYLVVCGGKLNRSYMFNYSNSICNTNSKYIGLINSGDYSSNICNKDMRSYSSYSFRVGNKNLTETNNNNHHNTIMNSNLIEISGMDITYNSLIGGLYNNIKSSTYNCLIMNGSNNNITNSSNCVIIGSNYYVFDTASVNSIVFGVKNTANQYGSIVTNSVVGPVFQLTRYYNYNIFIGTGKKIGVYKANISEGIFVGTGVDVLLTNGTSNNNFLGSGRLQMDGEGSNNVIFSSGQGGNVSNNNEKKFGNNSTFGKIDESKLVGSLDSYAFTLGLATYAGNSSFSFGSYIGNYEYCTSIGHNSYSKNVGIFSFVDGSTNNAITFSTSNTFNMRCANGGEWFSNTNLTAGVYLLAAGTGWNSVSDYNLKCNLRLMDPVDTLNALKQVPIMTWTFKNHMREFIGPMAQDIYKQFKVGKDEKYIDNLSLDGIKLSAIQSLNTKIEKIKSNIKRKYTFGREILDARIVKIRLETMNKEKPKLSYQLCSIGKSRVYINREWRDGYFEIGVLKPKGIVNWCIIETYS